MKEGTKSKQQLYELVFKKINAIVCKRAL